MEVMYDRKTHARYEVHQIVSQSEGLVAICYDTYLASSQNGNGWRTVLLKRLIPEGYVNKYDGTYISKTERNEIKNQLTLVDAIWECTDGMRYTHNALEGAITHQRMLNEAERTQK